MKALLFILISVFIFTISIPSISQTNSSQKVELKSSGFPSNPFKLSNPFHIWDFEFIHKFFSHEGHELKRFFRSLSKKLKSKVNYHKAFHYHGIFIFLSVIALSLSFCVPFI